MILQIKSIKKPFQEPMEGFAKKHLHPVNSKAVSSY